MKPTTSRLALTLVGALLLFTVPAVAQNGTGPAFDPADAFTVSGEVTAFTAAYGSGMPILVVDDSALGSIEVGLGPLWFIQNAGFSAAVGDMVEALVVECDICAADTVAFWVDNTTNGTSVVLRDDTGIPLWIQGQGTGGGRGFCDGQNVQAQVGEQRNGGSGGQGGNQGSGSNGGNGAGDGTGTGSGGNGSGPQDDPGSGGNGGNGGKGPGPGTYSGGQCGWTGPDMTQVTTATGTVVSLEVGFGDTRPTVVLDVDGTEVEILLAPYAPLAAAGFLIQTGMTLEITYAPWTIFSEDGSEEVFVALAVTDPATGLTVQLRDPETGYPVTGGGGGFGPGFGYGPGGN